MCVLYFLSDAPNSGRNTSWQTTLLMACLHYYTASPMKDVTVTLKCAVFELGAWDRQAKQNRSHPEMVCDTLRVTLNFDLSKIPSSHGQDLYSHQTHTTVLLLFWNMSGTTRVSRYQKGKTRKVKTNLDLLEQEIVSGSGIGWLYASLHLTPDNHTNIPPLSFYRPDALPAAQPTASKH